MSKATVAARLADRTMSLAASMPHGRGTEYFARAASVGNGVPLWLGWLAIVAATGRKGLRASASGLTAMALASASSNLAVKNTVKRKRPLPVPGKGRHKSSPSFPSSHAASAAAVATAVAVQWPAAGAPTVVLASAVALSRVQQRQHYISDVVAGAVLGAACGLAVHLAATEARRRRAHRDLNTNQV